VFVGLLRQKSLVTTDEDDLKTALEVNDAAAARVVEAVRKFGVEDKFIQISGVYIGPIYALGRCYEVSRSDSITLKDVRRCQDLVSLVIRNGATRFMRQTFRSSQIRNIEIKPGGWQSARPVKKPRL
jgi:uncharacterized protein YggE